MRSDKASHRNRTRTPLGPHGTFQPRLAVHWLRTPCEVFLEGQWYTFDARHNRRRIGRVLIGLGRDAADVPITMAFGKQSKLTAALAFNASHLLAAALKNGAAVCGPACQELGIGFVPFSPLVSGFLSGKVNANDTYKVLAETPGLKVTADVVERVFENRFEGQVSFTDARKQLSRRNQFLTLRAVDLKSYGFEVNSDLSDTWSFKVVSCDEPPTKTL
jgi:hypothetical protein